VVRLLIRIAIAVLANAIGLIVAALVLDDMSLNASGFLLAVAVFTAVELIALPALQKAAIRHSEALAGGSALASVLIALLVTSWLTDGLSISGAMTWLLATVIVWAIVLAAGVILPVTIFRRWRRERRS
jgi:putative membrane protein